jgi:hypothetical protein
MESERAWAKAAPPKALEARQRKIAAERTRDFFIEGSLDDMRALYHGYPPLDLLPPNYLW